MQAASGRVLGQSTAVNSIHTVPLTTPVTPNVVAEAVIDLDAIANNIRVLRDHAGSAAVMAVVKADGYGHGATPVSRAVLAAGATELGVATIAEALALRGQRFALIVKNGVATHVNIEAPGEFKVSAAEFVLKQL